MECLKSKERSKCLQHQEGRLGRPWWQIVRRGFCHIKVRGCGVFLTGGMVPGTACLKSGRECRSVLSFARKTCLCLELSPLEGAGRSPLPVWVAWGLRGPPGSWLCLHLGAARFYPLAMDGHHSVPYTSMPKRARHSVHTHWFRAPRWTFWTAQPSSLSPPARRVIFNWPVLFWILDVLIFNSEHSSRVDLKIRTRW